jgi:Icc-related predicted phosphoesterase
MTTNLETPIRIAAVGDVHCTKTSTGRLAPVFAEAARQADVLVLCGDLTDYGLPEEAHVLSKELEAAGSLPVLAVLGNHDFESGQQEKVEDILQEGGVQLMDGTSVEILGVAFAGVKGFAGGFGSYALQPWGEGAIKAFVREALDESLKLETALAKARSRQRVIVLHYAPIARTVEGEPVEIHPFLGSSRLEEPINRYGASVVFHGHAHRGTAEGQTKTGIPVFNVAMPLLRKTFPDRPPFRVYTLPVAAPPAAVSA